MPEKEFELYLSLLVKLLRLSPDQKTSIERELRDHFEERFESLVRQGMPRDEAIRRTLDEFGDVAGLANEFTHLSRRHIRRRIMQGTMATAGVAAAIVIWATLFRGPDPAVGPGPNVVAEERAEQEQAAGAVVEVAGAAPAAVAEGDVEWIDPGRFLPEKLAQPIDVQFAGTPLREVIAYIEDVHNLNILIDTATLSLEGITGEEEVTINMREAPLHAVLDMILRDVNDVPLAWIQESEVLLITTKDRADSTKTTQYYNVRDLLSAGYAHDDLTDVVMNTTEGPWEEIDGIGGSITAFGDLLVAKQCDRTQIDISCTLAGLRSTHREARIAELEQHAQLYAALDEPTQMDFFGTPLSEVISYIEEIHESPIFLETPVLSLEGITGEEEITITVDGIKLRSAFQLMLASVNDVSLDIVIRDGAMWVTTREAVDTKDLGTVVYDVSDITANDAVQMEKLLEVIKSQTNGPWEEIDGIGGVIDARIPGRLACRQSRRAQDEVRAVLAAVRASLEASGGDRSTLNLVSTKLETRFYRMDASAALDVAELIPNVIEQGTWKLFPDGVVGGAEPDPARIGTIHRLAAGRMLLRLDKGAVVDSAETSAQVGGTTAPPVTASPTKDASNEAGASDVVVIPQAVLIITHKPAVLRQVSKLLQSLLSERSWTWRGFDKDAVKFIAPGYQEGTWKGSLGGAAGPAPSASGFGGGGLGGGGFGGGGLGGGGGGFFSIREE